MFFFVALAHLTIGLASSTVLNSKIAGGLEASKGQFPWLVSVEATNFQEGWPLCGGILITEEWVLTAAHCLDSEKPEWLWVVSGEHDMEIDEGTEQYLLVDYFEQHEGYTYWATPYRNDVGLIHLSTPAVTDNYTSIAPLPIEGIDAIVGPCEEAGWGIIAEGLPGATTLRYTSVPLLPSEECETAYSTAPDVNALCAGDIGGGIGSCVGDNGGGLYCWSPNSQRYVVGGVISWREGCALPGKPGIYMDIAKYRDWILSIINASSISKG